MNETCKNCGGPIHWVLGEQRWYHDALTDIFTCGAFPVEPARVTA